MQARWTMKRLIALFLSVLMAVSCMPLCVLAEETADAAEDVGVDVIPEAAETQDADVPEPDSGVDSVAEEAQPMEEGDVADDIETWPFFGDEVPEEAGDMPSDEPQPGEDSQEQPLPDAAPEDELPAEQGDMPTEEPQTEEPPVDLRHPLQAAMDTYGSIYVSTVHQTRVFSDPALAEDALVYTTTQDIFLLLATEFTSRNTVMVWFLDENGQTVHGYVSADDLNEKYLLEEDLDEINFLPQGEGMTDLGVMTLFQVSGSYPDAGMEPVPEQSMEPEEDPDVPPMDDGLPVGDELFPDIESSSDETLPDQETSAPQTEEDESEPTDEPEMIPDWLFPDIESSSDETLPDQETSAPQTEEDESEPIDEPAMIPDWLFPDMESASDETPPSQETSAPETEEDESEPTDEPAMIPDWLFPDIESASDETPPSPETSTPETDESESTDEPEMIPDGLLPDGEAASQETPGIFPTEVETLPEAVPEYPEKPVTDLAGAYVGVTTDTRVFGRVDSQAETTRYSPEYLGNFVKDATVQILSVEQDEAAHTWYQVRFLYGDDFPDGRMKWTDYATAWLLAEETREASADACTVTDFAYTVEYLNMNLGGRRKLRMVSTPMNGFTLKNIQGAVGGFYAWQSGLYGSSGLDSSYPQLAKSPAHGTVYATPHYLEGFTVFCLEHTLSGPGEGSGHDASPTGPYVLVDMDTFVSNPDYGGLTGVRYQASTMHALGWVLRHTYPFMALNYNDVYNEEWSRVAGQFAMREVIKQLEGAQYVRSFWDMDNFYAFSGGAPAVYLTYARWLAENGIARSRITGDITASNQSLSVSGSQYVGTVTLTTDADRIRIPKAAGAITGNSGGSDNDYYYVNSGDTIQITSSESRFAVSMESISSDAEEANFLIGVPSVAIQKILVPLYGAPYALKSGSITFELGYGEIVVTKQSTDGVLLEGTVFELLNSEGASVATATTAADGTAKFPNLQPGSYTVREKTASQGYRLSAASQNVSVVAGVTSTATFMNERIMGRIRIIKTDQVTARPLPGAVFTVTRLSGPASDHASDIGKVVATITTNEQGIAETGLLPWGEYSIEETGVPEGYLDAGYTTTVWIKE